MTNSRYRGWLLNVVTGFATILAVAVVTVRLRESFLERKATGPRTRKITNWRDFGTVGLRIGPDTASVTIVEFSDFQCPYCRVAAGDLRTLRRQYSKDVAVIYRHFPIHKFARAASIAAECAARSGRFESFHDLLFAQSDSIGIKSWTRFATASGINDTVRFAACMSEPSIAALVSRDSTAAVALGATGTPTILINDLMVYGSPGFGRLNEYVKVAMKERHH